MSEGPKPVGTIGWIDISVADATGLRDFYTAVTGWTATGLDMGGYEDFVMSRPDGESAAGICHARGGNAGLPAQWLIYIIVADLDASLARARELGGEVLLGPKSAGPTQRYAVIRDPAGAVSALFEER
jgi:predicted enzyme related to lactoylglutathione lyase